MSAEEVAAAFIGHFYGQVFTNPNYNKSFTLKLYENKMYRLQHKIGMD